MNACDLQLVKLWPKRIRSAILNAISLAHYSIIYSRSWCANSSIARVQLAGKLDQAQNEISLLKEEIRIKDARTASIPPHHRPFYPPTERFAILELKAAHGWTLAQTARTFLIEPETVATWLRRVNEEGPHSLIRLNEPPNKFPDFVRHVVQRIKVLCPAMGKKRIANLLARAGLHLATSTVGRILNTSSPNKPDTQQHTNGISSPQVVTAKHPNHVWHIDLTTVPSSSVFWTMLFPFTLPQTWPFCWWVAIIEDHFSRKAIGFAVFKKQPTSLDVRLFIGRVMYKAKAKPCHLISDHGSQFKCTAFERWTKRKKIKLRYGAIGKHSSIAVIERFILSMKSEFTNYLLVPLIIEEFRYELGLYMTWYNQHRPHQGLDGKSPEEIYSNTQSQVPFLESIPNSRLPAMNLSVSFINSNKCLPIVELKKVA